MNDKTLGAYTRHEKHDAGDFANAEFARHPDGRVAHRVDPGTWQTTLPRESWVTWWGSDRDMAEDGFTPVRECPDPDEHVRYDAALADAEKAAQTIREQGTVIDELTAESRPLTPDAITDEMVERGFKQLTRMDNDGISLRSTWAARQVLEAALTEPPARPEWADLEDVLDAGWPEGINGAKNGYVARTLHEGGVRVAPEDGAA